VVAATYRWATQQHEENNATTADDGQWPFFSSLSFHYQDGCHTTSHTTFWCNTTCNTTVAPPHRPISRKTTLIAESRPLASLFSSDGIVWLS
jgi:hypothetical protein